MASRGTAMRSLDNWSTLARYARIVQAIPIPADAPDGLSTRFGRDPERLNGTLRRGRDP